MLFQHIADLASLQPVPPMDWQMSVSHTPTNRVRFTDYAFKPRDSYKVTLNGVKREVLEGSFAERIDGEGMYAFELNVSKYRNGIGVYGEFLFRYTFSNSEIGTGTGGDTGTGGGGLGEDNLPPSVIINPKKLQE